jgi:hypothetical protein
MVMRTKKLPWLIIGAAALFALTYVYWRGPDHNYDLLNYHYYAGYAFLHGRFFFDIAAAHLQSFLNPLPNVLAYTVLSFLPFPASAWTLAAVQLLSLPLLVLICQELDRDFGHDTPSIAALLALLLSLLAPLWWSELGTSFFESTLTPIVLLGLLFGLRGVAKAAKSLPAVGALVLAGFAIGLATGLKLTNAIFAVGLLAALMPLLLSLNIRLAIQYGLVCAGGLVAGFAATAWWNIHLARQWSSPLFPFYNALFQSPYFDSINFRDWRWEFRSVSDFLGFLSEATFGTSKTLEVRFADVRLLISVVLFGILMLAWAFRRFPAYTRRLPCAEGIVSKALLGFFAVSFALWAFLFAYQRYLIPLELLLGIAIWIMAGQLFRRDSIVSGLLAIGVAISFITLSVPDWNYSKSVKENRPNAFGLRLPSELVNQPANYLVTDAPISYIFPFMHHDSRFLRVDFSPRIDALIRHTLAQNENRPIRLMSREATVATAMDKWARFGFLPGNEPWYCWHFQSNIDSYVVCEVQVGQSDKRRVRRIVGETIDFRGATPLPPEVMGVTGLSFQEPWGRWSIQDEVQIHFAGCLPEGRLKIAIQGLAFGPNVGVPVPIIVGRGQTSVIFSSLNNHRHAILENKNGCQTVMRLLIPYKTSPSPLDLSGDPRELGIGLTSLRFDRSE